MPSNRMKQTHMDQARASGPDAVHAFRQDEGPDEVYKFILQYPV